jgi:hypothetical protein
MSTIQENHVEETTEEARQAENVKGMTTVLGISVAAVAVIFALMLLVFFAFTAGWL